MVRRQEIPEAGVQHHKEAAHDNTLAAPAVPDGGGADKTEHQMNADSPATEEAARDLERTILESYRLIVNTLAAANAMSDELIRSIESGKQH